MKSKMYWKQIKNDFHTNFIEYSWGKAIKVDLIKGGEKQAQIELLIGKAFRGATVDSGQQGGGNGKYWVRTKQSYFLLIF